MTDKQIKIDGVDVSGCDFLSKEDDYCSYSGEYRAYKGQCGCSDEEMCKDHPNCFYKKALKQLKRKEQECEELKQYKSLFEKTRNLWNESRMNNYKLLDEIKDLKDSLKRTICQSECYKHKEADKLKQTLAEIKDIAEKQCVCGVYCIDMKQILQKIRESEVENEI